MIGSAELKFTTLEFNSMKVRLLTRLGSRPDSKILALIVVVSLMVIGLPLYIADLDDGSLLLVVYLMTAFGDSGGRIVS